MNHAVLQVAIGGALGSVARYGVNVLAGRMVPGYPLGTLAVNVLGSLIMGLMAGIFAHRGGHHLAPLLMTGLLGGFTTFSAFSLDALTLWQRGEGVLATGYVLVSIFLSLAAVFAGLALARGAFA
ncbi:fluoride efflux transporter CrcB [Paracoccus sulfuroxidans]|uniref:Fluoride-specific ion channel FluC n=1 Tax=Paracoccus sulfuroxidans TaxID=384678 RepID=A0A562NTV2_9RHOB|nr:fluoride efflux transporter CrcB [Paracoccus sulfuroxidans]TWI35648.1 CrcB protein [Paracoccus sulfuroxidans]